MKNKTKMTLAVQLVMTRLTTLKTRIISFIIGVIAISLGMVIYGNSKSFGVGLVILGLLTVILNLTKYIHNYSYLSINSF